MSGVKRKLAAIMFTDLVGYTALMGRDELKALNILKINREIHKQHLKKFNGEWLKEMGDGILASFATISDAVYCAGAIQHTLKDHPDIELRIGIHVGEVVVQNNDVFGDGVNIASRIEALAPPKEIWVSESVYQNIKNKAGIELTYVGNETLKNLDKPIKLFSVEITKPHDAGVASVHDNIKAATRFWKPAIITVGVLLILLLITTNLINRFSGQTKISNEKSIAVLPFRNLSPNTENQYFADGIMDAILNDLARIGDLTVIPGTSVEQYRNTTKTAVQIGNELDVSYLLTGSAQPYADNIRITAKLIDARKNEQLWSENYDRDGSALLSTQSEIAQIVSRAMEAKLTRKEEEILRTAPTSSPEAYDLYLRGREYAKRYLNKTENQDYLNAQNLFYASIDADSNFALAYTGLAEIYYIRNYFEEFLEENPLDSVLLLCNRALDIDPNLEEAHAIRGKFYYNLEYSLEKAINDFENAININPNFVDALLELADIYRKVYNFKESFELLTKASTLVKGEDLIDLYVQFAEFYLHLSDFNKSRSYAQNILRLQPDNVWGYSLLAHINRCQGRSEDNLGIASKLLEINPRGRAQYDAAIIHMMNRDYQKAERFFRNLYSSSPDVITVHGYGDMHMFSYVLIKNGKQDEAQRNLEEVRDFMLDVVTKNRAMKRVIGYELAKVYSLLGNKEEALKWLEDYYQHGFEGGLDHFALYDPPLESIKEDPRFIEIIQKAKAQVTKNRNFIQKLEASLVVDQMAK